MTLLRVLVCAFVIVLAATTSIIEPAFLNGVGPRVDFHGLGAVNSHAYSAPYEDLTLKR